MTKKFEKAKVETIEKYSKVLEAVKTAIRIEMGTCGFCHRYKGCGECPIDELCWGELHVEVKTILEKLEGKVVEGIYLLEAMEEKRPRRK